MSAAGMLETAAATPSRAAPTLPGSAPGAAHSRTVLRTFDVFDTLIARRCIHPHQVFVEMERRTGISGLAKGRVDAEVAVAARSAAYGLHEIHAELICHLSLHDVDPRALMDVEVEIELENVVPIAQNLSRLTPDAVLLTDMYLPESVIHRLLRRAGVQDDLPIVRTPAGKATGQLWRELQTRRIQCVHLGDNAQSDVSQASLTGMRSLQCVRHHPSEFEQRLYVAGLIGTARAWRAARLATLDHGAPDWIRRLQVELNLPVLLVTAVVLDAFARDSGFEQLWFASRDGRLLQRVTQALQDRRGGVQPHCGYWFTSRYARTHADACYLDYCRDLLSGRSLTVDLCGTGASFARLVERLGLDGSTTRLFVSQYVDAPEYTQTMARAYGSRSLQPARPMHVFSTRDFIPNTVLEMMNVAPEGMVRGTIAIMGRPVPIRDPLDLEGEALASCAAQYAYAGAFIERLREELEPDVLDELTQGLGLLRDIVVTHASSLQADIQRLERAAFGMHGANETFLRTELAPRCDV